LARTSAATPKNKICTRAKVGASVPPNARAANPTPRMRETSTNLDITHPSRLFPAETGRSALQRWLSMLLLLVVTGAVAHSGIGEINGRPQHMRSGIESR